MANRKPLVLVSGGNQELQAADRIDGADIADGSIGDLKLSVSRSFGLYLPGVMGVRGGLNADGVYLGKFTVSGIGAAHADDGGVMTDETVPANEGTPNDMTLLPAVPAAQDAYYFGSIAGKFGALKLQIGTQGSGAWTITWEYWNGASWAGLVAHNLVDDTVGFTAAPGAVFVTFSPPSDWALTTVNLVEGYYIRARVSAYTSVITSPLGSQAWLYLVNIGSGIRVPMTGSLKYVSFAAAVLSASNADSKFAIYNVSSGAVRVATYTKASEVIVADLSGDPLPFTAGQQLVVMMIAEDGSTEYQDMNMLLEFGI